MPSSEYYADTRQAARCRSCQAPIEFAENVKTGKRMPFDAPMVALSTRRDPATHRLIEAVDLATSHFATCPQADQHRRTR